MSVRADLCQKDNGISEEEGLQTCYDGWVGEGGTGKKRQEAEPEVAESKMLRFFVGSDHGRED